MVIISLFLLIYYIVHWHIHFKPSSQGGVTHWGECYLPSSIYNNPTDDCDWLVSLWLMGNTSMHGKCFTFGLNAINCFSIIKIKAHIFTWFIQRQLHCLSVGKVKKSLVPPMTGKAFTLSGKTLTDLGLYARANRWPWLAPAFLMDRRTKEVMPHTLAESRNDTLTKLLISRGQARITEIHTVPYREESDMLYIQAIRPSGCRWNLQSAK